MAVATDLRIVAALNPCAQYRFRVDLPDQLDREALRRRALRETNAIFLGCTARYQAIGWVGDANLAFTDTRSCPADSLSEFLHLLFCLKLLELACESGDSREMAIEVNIPLRHQARMAVEMICAELGVKLLRPPVAASLRKPRIAGSFRAKSRESKPFTHEPLKRLDDARAAVGRRLAERPVLRGLANAILRAVMLPLWPLPIAARVVFSLWYRRAAARLLRENPRGPLVYFDLRLGRNRDIGAYRRWKFGSALGSALAFTHIARTCNAYGLRAMAWSARALADGCVNVSYLIPARQLLGLQFRRGAARKRVRKRLQEIATSTADPISRLVYREFIANLDHTHAFALEVSAGYGIFFDSLPPGVIIQADAVAKTARHFTASARRRGFRVIYVADRICTRFRTSNQLIADDSGNPHFPDGCVVFDRVSAEEFLRQGIPAEHVYRYRREFAGGREMPDSAAGGPAQVLILLQAYEDNIAAMIGLGAEIAEGCPEIEVVYQEHPNFPISAAARAASGGRFLAPGEVADLRRTFAQVTGYSSAAVPGVLRGVPLIWLRAQVENSIFCADFLDRIGFPADSAAEVAAFLRRFLDRDPALLEAAAAASRAAAEIFDSGAAITLADALTQAIRT